MKFFQIFKEMLYMIKKHKFYFMAPFLLMLAFLGILVFTLGPKAVLAFIYAGL